MTEAKTTTVMKKKKTTSKVKTNNDDSIRSKRRLKYRLEAQQSKYRVNNADGVLYIGNLPADMEEKELDTFLEQFGKIRNLRLSRSKDTGRSRGYAFVEMEDTKVANIVADTMSGYFILGEKRITCHMVPSEKVLEREETLFFPQARGSKAIELRKKQKMRKIQNREDAFNNMMMKKKKKKDDDNESTGGEKQKKNESSIVKRLLDRDEKKRQKLHEMGIDYDFPGVCSA